jgi:hypothetical protein
MFLSRQEEADEKARRLTEEIEEETTAMDLAEGNAAAKTENEAPQEIGGVEEIRREAVKQKDIFTIPPMPVNLWSPPPEVPPEKLGSGLNKKVSVYGLLN